MLTFNLDWKCYSWLKAGGGHIMFYCNYNLPHTTAAAEYIWFNSLDKLLQFAPDKKLLQFCSTIQLFVNEHFQ